MEATEEVRIVGIWGMGGIGKTTIARDLFKRISHKFQGSSFVRNVRENSSRKEGICALQQKILDNILGSPSGFVFHDPEDGAEVIQERCCRKKVLLVLDDVSDVEQLEFLARTREWFGLGSRIIITTRDQHWLSYADEYYKPSLLSGDQTVELFSVHAFNKKRLPEGYEELSFRAIHHAGGLPLALKVLGSFFHGRRKADVWESALERLAKTQDNKIFKPLKFSYDDLNDSEKQIFLDIACFYKGEYVKDVTRKLNSFGFYPGIGIKVLDEKSLITISSENKLEMHDLIQEMGRKIVQESVPNSRIWEPEKIHDLINKKQELELIEGIVLQREEGKESRLSADVFKSMKNLRVLDCYRKFTSCEPTYLPDELRWLCWRSYPFSSLPMEHMSKLVGLEMEWGKNEYLWKGEKIMLQNLKFIQVEFCESLTRFPDVSGAPNIESLSFFSCENMVEVDESVGNLKKLLHLKFYHCNNLTCLPSMLHMESLETLILSACFSLKRIPEFSPCMVNLSKLDIISCYELEELPSSITYLSNLRDLNLHQCDRLEYIPNSILELKCLNTLYIDSIHIYAFTTICYLRELYLNGDFTDNDFPQNPHVLSFLEELHIENNSKLIQLPESISHLSRLKYLLIEGGSGLQTLHGLPPGIQVLTVDCCKLLENIEDLSKEYKCLNKIRISDCEKLLEGEMNRRYLDKMLEESFIKKWAVVDGCLIINIPGSNIPSWFAEQQDGRKIALKLPPNWQSEIIGFAFCCVLTADLRDPEIDIKLKFDNDEILVSKSENNITVTKYADWNLCIGYIPYSLFEQLHGDNDNLVFEISSYWHVVRCGFKVVYREDVASIQQTIPSLFSSYWGWKLTNEFFNSFKCSEES